MPEKRSSPRFFTSQLHSAHPSHLAIRFLNCVVFVIARAMRLPRAAWAWSAFQVDTALFMYGGVPTVAIPTEAIHQQQPPKRKATKVPDETPKPSKRQSLRRSLSSTTELRRTLSKLL